MKEPKKTKKPKVKLRNIYRVALRTLIEASIVAAACGSIAVLFYVVVGVLAQ